MLFDASLLQTEIENSKELMQKAIRENLNCDEFLLEKLDKTHFEVESTLAYWKVAYEKEKANLDDQQKTDSKQDINDGNGEKSATIETHDLNKTQIKKLSFEVKENSCCSNKSDEANIKQSLDQKQSKQLQKRQQPLPKPFTTSMNSVSYGVRRSCHRCRIF